MKIDPKKLRQVSVFQNATEEDLELIAAHAIERSIEEGEFFFFQGDPADFVSMDRTSQGRTAGSDRASPNTERR